MLEHLVGLEAAVLTKDMLIGECLLAALHRDQGYEASHFLLATLGHIIENQVVHGGVVALRAV